MQLGKLRFSITGIGVAPNEREPIIFKSVLNSSISHPLSFRNPLRYEASLFFSVKGKDSKSFAIFTRHSKIPFVLRTGKSIDLALVFSPKKMYQHTAVFSISTEIACTCTSCEENCNAKHELCWEYSLLGQPQVILTPFDKAPTLMAESKTMINTTIAVQLNACSDINNAVILKDKCQGKLVPLFFFNNNGIVK